MYYWDLTPAVWTISLGQWARQSLWYIKPKYLYCAIDIQTWNVGENDKSGHVLSSRAGDHLYSEVGTDYGPYEVSRLESYLTGTGTWAESTKHHHKYSLISLFSCARPMFHCPPVECETRGLHSSPHQRERERVKYKNWTELIMTNNNPLIVSLSHRGRDCIFYEQRRVQFQWT